MQVFGSEQTTIIIPKDIEKWLIAKRLSQQGLAMLMDPQRPAEFKRLVETSIENLDQQLFKPVNINEVPLSNFRKTISDFIIKCHDTRYADASIRPQHLLINKSVSEQKKLSNP